MAVKVTKGLICSGTISKIKCQTDYYLYEKFHTFSQLAQNCPILALCRYTTYVCVIVRMYVYHTLHACTYITSRVLVVAIYYKLLIIL